MCKSSGGIYGLGFLGSLVYFLQNSSGLWEFILAFIKAILWPALLAYEAFGKLLG